jgi:hypothetical protein
MARGAGVAFRQGRGEAMKRPWPVNSPGKFTVRTAYLALDEVNAHEAAQLGSRCGHAMRLLDLRSADLVAEARLILDLDCLPPEDAQRLLEQLVPALKGRLAVHGYNLRGEVICRLMRSGVVVRRLLDTTLFRRLGSRRAAPAKTCERLTDTILAPTANPRRTCHARRPARPASAPPGDAAADRWVV